MILSLEEMDRYAPQIQLSEIGFDGQKKLKAAKVLCIGAGGLGSSALSYLAAAGVGTIGIVDDGYLELSNLNRQILYSSEGIGQLKVDLAKKRLLEINPLIHIETYAEKIALYNAEDLVQQYDIVLDCTDNFEARYCINDACFKAKKPFIFAGISRFEGQCSLFSGREGPCLRCLFPEDNKIHIQNCATSGVLGVTAGFLGIIQAAEALKWVLNIGRPLVRQLLVLDLLSMTFRTFTLQKNIGCSCLAVV